MARPDDCEQNQSLAYAINVEATVQLLLNAEVHKSHFIFVSTDFVFDGEKGMYSESDQPHPVNYYGRTKLEAEEGRADTDHRFSGTKTRRLMMSSMQTSSLYIRRFALIAATSSLFLSGFAMAQGSGSGGSSTAVKTQGPREAPVGHRQPRADQVPSERTLTDPNDPVNREAMALDRKLKSICRGC